jgi:hypothetical protein
VLLFLLTAYPAFYLMVAWQSLAVCVLVVGWPQLVNAGDSGVLRLQYRRDDIRRLCPVRRNLADRADRRQPVAELLPLCSPRC